MLAVPLMVEAQRSGQPARMGTLVFGPPPNEEELALVPRNFFWSAMKELGWIYGQNIVVERRYGESLDQLRAAAADLVRLKVDVLFTQSAGLAKILQLESKTIPIVVWAAGGDLVAAGLVANLARPGGNLTGVQISAGDLVPKRLEFLKALVPNLSRVAFLQEDVFTRSVVPQIVAQYEEQAATAAQTLGLKIHRVIVHRPDEFPAAFRDMANTRDQGLLVLTTPFINVHLKEIVELAAKQGIVAVYEHAGFVEAGGLMSYGGNSRERTRRAAFLVDKILKGAKPGDLPVEEQMKFDLVINMKTAKALRLTIPQTFLLQADKVIE
jgi:putative ABC transport system substrate-binding protein